LMARAGTLFRNWSGLVIDYGLCPARRPGGLIIFNALKNLFYFVLILLRHNSPARITS
jgi:hypothetical protein